MCISRQKCICMGVVMCVVLVGRVCGDEFGPGGIDEFGSWGILKVQFLNGDTLNPGVDGPVVVGRSDPFTGETEPDDVIIVGGDTEVYPGTCEVAPVPCRRPAGFMPSATTRMVRTEILDMNLTGAFVLKAGSSYYGDPGVDDEVRDSFYQCSFGEVAPWSASGDPNDGDPNEDFPADSYFNIFVEVDAGGMRLFNLTPMVLSCAIRSFPPDLKLPTNPYYDHEFRPVPLFSAAGIHVANLVSAKHGFDSGGGGGVELKDAPPYVDESDSILFVVAAASEGLPAGQSMPNNVRDDNGLGAQQVTVYQRNSMAGMASLNSNVRTDGLTGLVGSPGSFSSGDTIMSISRGQDGTRVNVDPYEKTEGTLMFSVDPDTIGEDCTDVWYSSQAGNDTPTGIKPRQAGSIYVSGGGIFGDYSDDAILATESGANYMALDGTGLALRPSFPYTGQDDVAGLEISSYDPNDMLFCTFTGPSFTGLSSTIFVYDPNEDPESKPFDYDNLTVYSGPGNLGLTAADVIDAIALSDLTISCPPSGPCFGMTPNGSVDPGTDMVLFSLAPGSPTLLGPDGAPGLIGVNDDDDGETDEADEAGLGDDYTPADILLSEFDGSFSVFASAESLGLLISGDNVDGLDIRPTLSLCGDINNPGDRLGDFDDDCNANLDDFLIVAAAWLLLDESASPGGDANLDGSVDLLDLKIIGDDWLYALYVHTP